MKIEDIKKELIEGLGHHPPEDWNSIFWLFAFPYKNDWPLLHLKLMDSKIEEHHVQPEASIDLLCETVSKIQEILNECASKDEEYKDFSLPCLMYGRVYGLSAFRFHISKDSLSVDYEIWN